MLLYIMMYIMLAYVLLFDIMLFVCIMLFVSFFAIDFCFHSCLDLLTHCLFISCIIFHHDSPFNLLFFLILCSHSFFIIYVLS